MRWDTSSNAFRLDDGTMVGRVDNQRLDELRLSLEGMRDVPLASLKAAADEARRLLPPPKYKREPPPEWLADEWPANDLSSRDRYHQITRAYLTDVEVSLASEEPFTTIYLGLAANGAIYAETSHPDPFFTEEEDIKGVLDHLARLRRLTIEYVAYQRADDVVSDHVSLLLKIGDTTQTLRDVEEFCALATELLRMRPPMGSVARRPERLDWELTRRLLLFGYTAHLTGQPESAWLEVKSHGYDCDDPAQQIELAQDVARFANGDGPGLLVLGYRTKRVSGQDVIQKHCPLPIDRPTCERYRAILDQRVFPPVRGLSVDHVQHDRGASVIITIPEQHDHERPFLVHGAMVDGRHEGAFISIVRRRGEHSIPVNPAAIHAALAAGRRVLRSGLDLQ